MAVQLVTRARSAFRKSVGMEKFATAYSPYFIYNERTALLHVIVPGENGFSPSSQRESVAGVEGPPKTHNVADKAAWKSFGAVDHAMRPSSFQFVTHLQALLGGKSL